jgi:16S rRNA (guanine527-N7)-methyltransferase
MKDFALDLFSFYKKELQGINLIGFKNFEDFYQTQFMDIIDLIESYKDFIHHDILVDMGCGGGFPLIPLIKIFPQKKFSGIDSKKKKIKALKTICEKFNLDAQLFDNRFEEIEFNKSATLFFKAIDKIDNIIPLLNISQPCDLIFFKGKEEIHNIKSLEHKYISCNIEKRIYIIRNFTSMVVKKNLVSFKDFF